MACSEGWWGRRAAWGGQNNEWTGCLLDGLGAFGINVDQEMTAAQDEGGWRMVGNLPRVGLATFPG